jgi:hypothetical protein
MSRIIYSCKKYFFVIYYILLVDNFEFENKETKNEIRYGRLAECRQEHTF